jgi:hypothetical protein
MLDADEIDDSDGMRSEVMEEWTFGEVPGAEGLDPLFSSSFIWGEREDRCSYDRVKP